MTDNFDKIYDGCSALNKESERLFDISDAFYRTGNDTMGLELASIASEMSGCANQIRKAYGSEIAGRARDAEQSSKNMVEAVLASHLMTDGEANNK